jgi:hypothetical protein
MSTTIPLGAYVNELALDSPSARKVPTRNFWFPPERLKTERFRLSAGSILAQADTEWNNQ